MEHWHIVLITTAVQVGVGLFILVIGSLLKRSIAQIDRQLSEGDKKYDALRCDMEKMKEIRGLDREYFAKEYVSKDDFIRDIHALDVKIDGVAADVKELLRSQKASGL